MAALRRKEEGRGRFLQTWLLRFTAQTTGHLRQPRHPCEGLFGRGCFARCANHGTLGTAPFPAAPLHNHGSLVSEYHGDSGHARTEQSVYEQSVAVVQGAVCIAPAAGGAKEGVTSGTPDDFTPGSHSRPCSTACRQWSTSASVIGASSRSSSFWSSQSVSPGWAGLSGPRFSISQIPLPPSCRSGTA